MTAHMETPPAIRTTCPYCGVGCGVLVSPDGAGGASVTGDPEHPANFGRLCSKGTALGETLSLETRLLHPLVDGVNVPLASALDTVAERLRDVIAAHGPESVAFYLSGQLLTEDYYVANKLAKGFVGTPNVDTNSRLCMASSVAGHRRSFGADTVPGAYADLDEADLVVLVGSNAAWCHPVLFQRMLAARAARGTRLIVLDPRRTATAESADLHVALRSGTDTVLFSRLLVEIAEAGEIHRTFVDAHTEGLVDLLAAARAIAPTRRAVADACGISEEMVGAFTTAWRATSKVVTAYSQGVNQSAQGTDKVTTIVACHLASGRIGTPGAGPFSLTGQPNAMGGREVGGLANMLAAHMGFSADEIDRVRRFWDAPNIVSGPGLKAVELFDAIAGGRIKALWVMGTNPAVSLPRADRVREALAKLALFVVSENVASNDTLLAGAHVRLPAAAWGEKDGTVTNSERRISRQRPFLALPGEVRPDWWLIAEVGRRLGHGAAFAHASPAAIFREHAALSAFENDGSRVFDIGGLAELSDAEYETLAPVQWPTPRGRPGGTERLYSDGRFASADRKARFWPPAVPALACATDDTLPLRLNTGRVRDQWHTMTRTGLSPRLGSHRPVPFVEVSPQDAARARVENGGLARVASPHGSAVLEVVVTEDVAPGEIFVPIHWSAETSSHGRVGALVQPVVDPYSGQPEAKATPVTIEPVTTRTRGFVLSRTPLTMPPGIWWARVALAHGFGYRVADERPVEAVAREWADAMFRAAERAELVDFARGVFRVVASRGAGIVGALVLGPGTERADWDGMSAALATTGESTHARIAALAGRAVGVGDAGPLVCACHGVGRTTIMRAIERGASDLAAVGAVTRAGTNCGSCVPELRRLVEETARAPA